MYTDQYCHKFYGSRSPTATQICAGHNKDNQNTCRYYLYYVINTKI
ncbi:unnamed protein product, partial [Leptidea sinapis]